MTPTRTAYAFLYALVRSRAAHALTCPAISEQGARQWGIEGATGLWGWMQDGTIESIDGEPCIQQDPAMSQRERVEAVHNHAQGRLL